MTKYVLNSGNANRHPKLRREFHQELISGLGHGPKFLICSFAQIRENWNFKFESYTEAITEDMPSDVEPSFELAMPDTFKDQCTNTDIVYCNGGDDTLLKYWMSQFDLAEIFKGKVVGTSSASSSMLAKGYWTCDWRQCANGFGILPIKFIPHYGSDFGNNDPRGPINWQRAHDELKSYGDPSLPIYTLKEGESAVFKQ